MSYFNFTPQVVLADEFDMTEMLAQMGLNEGGKVIMAYAGSGQWKDRGRIVRGHELHGSSLPSSWVSAWNPSYPTELAAIQNSYWNGINPWEVVFPAAGNTCTNAGVQVRGAEIYILRADTGIWERVSYSITELMRSVGYYSVDAFADLGVTAEAVYNAAWGNIPAFCPVPVVGDRAASSSDTAKYRAMHTSLLPYAQMDGANVAAVFATCQVRLVPVSGGSLNGTPEILFQLGIDAEPEYTDTVGTGNLIGAINKPALCNGRFNLIPADGTWRRVYCSTYRHPAASVTVSEAYGDVASVFTNNPVKRQYA